MRKVTSFLICAVICSCLILPVCADSAVYTVSSNVSVPAVKIGEDISVILDVNSGKDSSFAAAEIILQYDSSALSFSSVEGIDFNMVSTKNPGVLRLESYGLNKNTGENVCVFHFSALAQGDTTIHFNAASFSNRRDAATKDLTPATILNKNVQITVVPPNTQPVIISNLTDIVIDGDNYIPTGENYTFSFSGSAFYKYSIVAMMAGKNVEIVDNGDGSYTVCNVTDTLNITVEKTPVTFGISFEGNKKAELPEDDVMTHGEDYSFTIPARTGYETKLVSICYSDGTDVPFLLRGNTVTIRGENIIDDVIVTLQQTMIFDGDEKSAKTGDEAMPILWSVIFVLCTVAIPVAKRCRRKKT